VPELRSAKMIQQTSVEAYRKITENGLLSRRRLQVYEEIFKFQPISINKLIMNLSRPGLNTGSITGRISELQRLGVIEAWGTEIAPTGHEVILWKTTGSLPGKIPQKKTRRQLEMEILRLTQIVHRVEGDINWMLNNQRFLNRDVFLYLDKAIDQQSGLADQIAALQQEPRRGE
jgi:plasmid maintenance system antidote protein VapI